MRGEGGIRTPDAGITDVTVFETAAFNHSATSPLLSLSTRLRPFNHPSNIDFLLIELVLYGYAAGERFALSHCAREWILLPRTREKPVSKPVSTGSDLVCA